MSDHPGYIIWYRMPWNELEKGRAFYCADTDAMKATLRRECFDKGEPIVEGGKRGTPESIAEELLANGIEYFGCDPCFHLIDLSRLNA